MTKTEFLHTLLIVSILIFSSYPFIPLDASVSMGWSISFICFYFALSSSFLLLFKKTFQQFLLWCFSCFLVFLFSFFLGFLSGGIVLFIFVIYSSDISKQICCFTSMLFPKVLVLVLCILFRFYIFSPLKYLISIVVNFFL